MQPIPLNKDLSNRATIDLADPLTGGSGHEKVAIKRPLGNPPQDIVPVKKRENSPLVRLASHPSLSMLSVR
jgi:hypothetical protein